MNHLTAGMIFYDDGPELLRKAILALKANNIPVIAIDGAFTELLACDPKRKAHSTDGCIDVARECADKYVPSPTGGWLHQWQKRNVYVNEVETGDFFVVIDADEIINLFQSPLVLAEDIYRIMERRTYLDGHSDYFSTTRVYKKYSDLAYQYRHCSIYRLDQHDPADYHSGCITTAKGAMNQTRPILLDAAGKDIFIEHDYRWRPDSRHALKEAFYKKREENQYGLV